MNSEVVLIVKFTAKSEYAGKVRDAFLRLVEPTRKEKGCVVYNLHVEEGRNNIIWFYEIWEDQESLDLHSSTALFNEVMAEVADCMDSPAEVINLNKQK